MPPPPKDPRPAAGNNDAREAVGWLHTARFVTTASRLQELPPSAEPEIAFVGRSNVGKSSAINTLTQQTRLAYASRTPGRTQHINLFAVGREGRTDALLADLPGYGYAAVPQAEKARWQQMLARYLQERPNLVAVVLLCDARRGLGTLDNALLELIRPRVEHGLQFLLLLTKADKLKRREQDQALAIARLQAAGGQVLLFSALKRRGVEQAALWLRRQAIEGSEAATTESA